MISRSCRHPDYLVHAIWSHDQKLPIKTYLLTYWDENVSAVAVLPSPAIGSLLTRRHGDL